ncbi:MFS transporter [bacterium]|jgi:MFS family permease|nr:MFS transporter [bacterium]MBT3850667.1 MFS transporter [bacterium]MBT4435037.1 MFS transporter [bacterium]MDG2446238.1 MFS transporter [Thermodesulfobacteriota bacterium]NSW99959.1 MFS transporter [bacterium]
MDLLLYVFAFRFIATTFDISGPQAALLFSITLASSALGGMVFGVISDYVGRVKALTYSILIYSFFTMLSAFAPNIAFFVVCRFLLGLGMGGEWASGEILVAESWPKEHRGKVVGMVQSGWGFGFIFAALLATFVLPIETFNLNMIPFVSTDFPVESWRVLFFLGVIPAFLVFYVRRVCEEPEVWKKSAEARLHTKQEFTFFEIFKSDEIRPMVIKATLLTSFCMLSYWGLSYFVPNYLASPISEGGAGLGIVKGFGFTIPLNIGAIIGCISFGLISDKIGRKTTFGSYLIIVALLVPIFGNIVKVQEFLGFISLEALILILAPLLGFFATGFYSGFGAIFAEIFPTRARGTAQGFSYNVGRGASAIAPPLFAFIAVSSFAFLFNGEVIGNGRALITASLFAICAFFVLMTLPETKGKDLDE